METVERDIFVSLLCELNDTQLISEFLTQVLPKDSKITVDKSLVAYCNRNGWADVAAALADTLKTVDHSTVARNATILEQICTTGDRNSERLKACRTLCDVFVTALVAFDTSCDSNNWQIRQIDRKEILSSLISSMIAVDAGRLLKTFVKHTLLATDHYNLIADHLAALFAIKARLMKLNTPNKGIDDWLERCQAELHLRTAAMPQPPADFGRDDRFKCDGTDCRVVKTFLADPEENKLILPLAKRRRQHLHGQMDGNRIDLTHVTQRTGSPHKLVLCKTDASFRKAIEVYERDLEFLAEVERIRKARKEKSIPSTRRK